jgi:signal transduction histidine kinase
VTVNLIKKASTFFGPYPYNPTLVFLFFFTHYVDRFLPDVIAAEIGGPRWRVAMVAMAVAVLSSGAFSLITILFTRYRRWSENNFLFYYLEITFGLAVATGLRSLVRPYVESNFDLSFGFDLLSSPIIFFWGTLITVFVFSLMHRAEKAIVGRLNTANTLVEKLEVDRQELVRADEQTRKQLTQFLHDRVQSELMVLAIRIENVGDKIDPSSATELSKISSRMEKIRRTDLKMVGQILSPNLEGIGLEASLVELSQQYESDISFEITIDDSLVEHSDQLALGVYRIVEQAFVNAITHGPAKNVNVKLEPSQASHLVVSVTDDGPGADPSKTVSGVGTAVIDSWVSILKATKDVTTKPGEGYKLSVTIPL